VNLRKDHYQVLLCHCANRESAAGGRQMWGPFRSLSAGLLGGVGFSGPVGGDPGRRALVDLLRARRVLTRATVPSTARRGPSVRLGLPSSVSFLAIHIHHSAYLSTLLPRVIVGAGEAHTSKPFQPTAVGREGTLTC